MTQVDWVLINLVEKVKHSLSRTSTFGKVCVRISLVEQISVCELKPLAFHGRFLFSVISRLARHINK